MLRSVLTMPPVSSVTTSALSLGSDGVLTAPSAEVTVQLSPQLHRILALLIHRRGELVTYADLRSLVWEGAIVEDSAIHKNVSRLRQSLAEAGVDEPFVETVPRRGYRWSGPLAEETAEVLAIPEARPAPWRRFSKTAAILLAAGIILAGGMATVGALRPSPRAKAEALYRQGLGVWNRRDIMSDGESLQLFRAAIAADPRYTPAYVGVANALLFQSTPAPGAREAIEQALRVDPTYGPAYTSRGFLKMVHEWDWRAASADFSHGLQLAANDATVRHWQGVYLAALGNYDGSAEWLSHARRLAPESSAIARTYAKVLFDLGKREQALREIDALRARERSTPRKSPFVWRDTLLLHWLAGDLDKRTDLLAEGIGSAHDQVLQPYCNQDVPEYYVAACASLRGDPDGAIEHLHRAVSLHDFDVFWMKADPALQAIRSDARFIEVLYRVGLN
jgi:DNA-binding winged helix-turn-helix (wHTH) protein